MGTKFKVDGTAVWASVHQPNKFSGAYSIDLVVDDKGKAQLEELGLKPASRRDGSAVTYDEFPGHVFRFKRKTAKRDGSAMEAPGVYDAAGNVTKVLIGNGSKVRIYGNAYNYEFNGLKGTNAGLNNVQIIDLVEFGGGGIDKIDGGFVSSDEDQVDVIKPINPRDVI